MPTKYTTIMNNSNRKFNIKITHIELNGNNIIIGFLLDNTQPPAPDQPAPVPEGQLYWSDGPEPECLPEGPEAITIAEASKILNCVETTVDNMRQDGRLKSYYRGRSVRLRRAQVVAARGWWSGPKGKI